MFDARSLLVTALCFSALASPAIAQQKLRVATEGAYPPFNFVDDAGQLGGFDVDIAKAICADLKADCSFVAVPWADIIDGLRKNDYDMIVASMASTPEREALVDFSDPYYRSFTAFVGDATKFTDTTPKALAGKTIATNEGTIQADFLAASYGESKVVLTVDQPSAYKLLAAGTADLMLGDAIEQLSFLESPEGASFGYIGDPVTNDVMQTAARVAVRDKDDALRNDVNEALKHIRLDGTYDRINATYFPFSIF